MSFYLERDFTLIHHLPQVALSLACQDLALLDDSGMVLRLLEMRFTHDQVQFEQIHYSANYI